MKQFEEAVPDLSDRYNFYESLVNLIKKRHQDLTVWLKSQNDVLHDLSSQNEVVERKLKSKEEEVLSVSKYLSFKIAISVIGCFFNDFSFVVFVLVKDCYLACLEFSPL